MGTTEPSATLIGKKICEASHGAMFLTIFFDLSSIASLGAIFYIVMDIVIHWGVLKHLRKDVEASAIILVMAITLDILVLAALIWVKIQKDMIVIYASIVGFILIFTGEKLFLKYRKQNGESA